MADISMCDGMNCEVREYCKRFRAVPNEHWQSYILPMYDRFYKDCPNFMLHSEKDREYIEENYPRLLGGEPDVNA